MVDPPLNPYAPPVAVDIVQTATGDFDIGRTVSEAWEAVKRYFPLWLGVMLVGGLLMLVSVFTCIGYILAVPVLGWGMIKFLLNMIEGQPTLDDLFSGFRNYGAILGRMLLLGLIYMLMAVASEGLVFVGQYTHSTGLQVVGWVVYMAFFMGVLVRLYFSLFLIVDKNLGALDALAGSWRMTEGKALKVIGLAILSGLIGAAGILACGVGLFASIMMSYLMFASAYRQMVGSAPAQAVPVPSYY